MGCIAAESSSSGIWAGTGVVPRRPVKGANVGFVLAPFSISLNAIGAVLGRRGLELAAGMLEGLLDRLFHFTASADIGPF